VNLRGKTREYRGTSQTLAKKTEDHSGNLEILAKKKMFQKKTLPGGYFSEKRRKQIRRKGHFFSEIRRGMKYHVAIGLREGEKRRTNENKDQRSSKPSQKLREGFKVGSRKENCG